MSRPSISIREIPYKHKCKENLLAVNSHNVCLSNEQNTDEYLYMPSEISQLFAKLLLDSTVYVELSRLFKISLNKSIGFLQIIIAENVSNEQLIVDNYFFKENSLFHYFNENKFEHINFLSPSSSKLCGLDEFLTIPLKNLTVLGAELIGQSVKPPTPQILLSTPSEMFWDTVPFPKRKCSDSFVYSQNTYSTPDNDPANLLAIDCEMVNTGDEDDLELARVSVVRCCQNADLKSVKGIKQWLSLSKQSAYEVVYDSLVKPERAVVDYLTKYSGITEKTLENVVTTLSEVHVVLKNLIKPNTILVGHSIQSDLKALKLFHPYIIDTSSIYNICGDFTRKPGLLPLSNEILKQEMRKSANKGHDSVEDAQTALRLVILKLSKDLNFGNRTRPVPHQPNPILAEWKNVSNIKGSQKDETSNSIKVSPLGNLLPIHSKIVSKCVIQCNDTQNYLDSIENIDAQAKLDKFLLLKEQPAVVKITELLYKTNLAMEIIVNVNGTIGKQQVDNMCSSVIKVSNDTDVVRETAESCKKCDALISVLSDYNEFPNSDLTFSRILSIQQNIKEIVQGVPRKSAIFVILPGTNGMPSIGKFFWKIS